jgi:hypothetical protein
VGDAVGETVGEVVGNSVGASVMHTLSPLQTRVDIEFKISTVRLHDVSTFPPSARGVHEPHVSGHWLANTGVAQIPTPPHAAFGSSSHFDPSNNVPI